MMATLASTENPPRPAEDGILFDYLLRLGDDSLVLGQRLSEWCGHAPSIEVDLSLANMALDLIGQATHFLGAAGDVEGKGRSRSGDGSQPSAAAPGAWRPRDADGLAFHRDVLDFRNCLLVEQPNGDFAQTMARQFLFSTWQKMLFDHLAGSSDARIAEVAAKAVKEVAYHQDLSAEWVIRLGDGTAESRRRLAEGLDWMWRFVPELFEMDEIAVEAARSGIGVDVGLFREDYDRRIRAVLAEATVEPPAGQRPILGGRRGHHSEHLGHLLAAMQFLPRTYPDAAW